CIFFRMTRVAPCQAVTLDYATPSRDARVSAALMVVAVVFALGGLLLNGACIAGLVREFDRDRYVYHDLKQDPRAFGRTIDPDVIESLRRPIGLWLAIGFMTCCSAAGMLFAVNLLIAAAMWRWRPRRAAQRLEEYVRWKRAGAMATTIAFYGLAR